MASPLGGLLIQEGNSGGGCNLWTQGLGYRSPNPAPMNRRDFLKNSALAALLVSPLAVTAKSSGKEVSLVPGSPEWKRLEQAIPAVPTVKPLKPRRLLIFNRNLEYDGHRASILAGSEAFRLFGERTGAFEAVISEDPAMFDRETLSGFDAVFLNNNIGACVAEPERRQNLLEFVTRGRRPDGGAWNLIGLHQVAVAALGGLGGVRAYDRRARCESSRRLRQGTHRHGLG